MNSPNNPTGRVLDDAELMAVAEFAQDHDLLVFTDEMYEKILYDGHRHVSIATLPGMADRTLTFNGLSKGLCHDRLAARLRGRPRPFMEQIEKVHSHSVTCATSFVQKAGIAALTGPQEFIAEMVSAWDRRRHRVADGLNQIKGIACPLVEGALRLCRCPGDRPDVYQAADLFLQEAHVAVTPGIAFGAAGEGHVRLSFATSDELLEQAVDRIGHVLGRKAA